MAHFRFTQASIDKIVLSPGGIQDIYWDELLPGFGLRVGKGKKTYFIERRIDRKVRRISIGSTTDLTLDMARKQAKSIAGKIATGQNPVAEKKALITSAITLEQVLDSYIVMREATGGLKEETIRDYKKTTRIYLKDWAKKPWTSITKQKVLDRFGELCKENGRARANGAMRVLRLLMNYAITRYRGPNDEPLLAENPVSILKTNKMLAPVQAKTTHVKPHQLSAWMKAVIKLRDDTVKEYFMFTLFTGARRNEVASLRWDQVDLKNKTFVFTDTKNHRDHTLPMSNFLFELLSARRETASSPFVFPSPRSGTKKGHITEFKKACDRIEAETGFRTTVHDLRRTFLTIAESLDIPTYALKALVNHKSKADVTGNYIQISAERLRVPMQKITDYLIENTGILHESLMSGEIDR